MDAVTRFASMVAAPAPQLDRCTLGIAAGANPTLDPDTWLRRLDRLAGGVDSVDSLVYRLFVTEGFTGDRKRYYDSRNSLLDQVLSRRLGIPITLSIVTIEVGRRVGLTLRGVGMPGHFLVLDGLSGAYLDPFGGGARLDVAGCERLFRSTTQAGPDVAFDERMLAPTPTSAILTRVLQNLRAVYRAQQRFADLEWTLRMRLALPDIEVSDVLELGHAIGAQARYREAATLLQRRAGEFPAHAEAMNRAAEGLLANLN